MKISDTFQKAKEVLLEQGWTQKQERNSSGQVCLYGALKDVDPTVIRGVFGCRSSNFLLNFIARKTERPAISLGRWNDAPERTLSEVLDLLDEATIAAKEAGL